MTKVRGIAHQAIGVRDIPRSIAFYTEVFGMELMSYLEESSVAFLSLGTRDHDVALVKIPEGQSVGSSGAAHTAFEIDGGPAELRELYVRLQAQGVEVDLTVDHQVSYSLYLMDPDGNRLEIFAHMMSFDVARDFRRETTSVRDVMRPLDMDTLAV
jgi:catechol 2,3-dioxygenase